MNCWFSFRSFLLTMLAALLFLSAAVASRPPYKLLSVSAPTPWEVHTVGGWYERHIPARFRARQAVSVSLLSGPDMTVYLESNHEANDTGNTADQDDGDIDGVFENSPPTITLRLPSNGIPDEQIFAHEYGHYVWFDLLSDSDRQRYQKIYDRQKAAYSLITDYSGDSVQEGFAEAFSYYAAHPALLARRDALSYQFLARWPSE